MKVKCIKDTLGYWSEGEEYDAEPTKGGFIIIGDDEDPRAGWAVVLVAWDPVVGGTYALQGTDGEAEFMEVRDGK